MSQIAAIAPLRPMAAGATYPVAGVPPHLTLLPISEVPDVRFDRLVKSLRAVSSSLLPITVIAQNEEMFGPTGDVPVFVLDPTADLMRAHQLLLASAAEAGATPVEPQYTAGGFRPHVTNTREPVTLHPGWRTTVNQVAVVMIADGNVRVLEVVDLCSSTRVICRERE